MMAAARAFNHARMKGWLICCAFAVSSVASAATMIANSQEQQRVAVEAKPVSTRPFTTAQPQSHAQASTQSAQVRHLSDEERAELRRQLQQFNRQFGKRS
jgi:uncharacterized membrane protein